MRSLFFSLTLLLMTPSLIISSEPNRLIIKCIDSSLTEKIRNTIENVEIEEYPFPHVVIHDFFPEDFYDEFVNNWPHPHQFSPKSNERYSISMDHLKSSKLTNNQKAFWGTFNDYLVETILKPVIIKKFLPYLKIKFPEATSEEIAQMVENFQPLANSNSIYLDTPDCSVVTHTDRPHCFIQLIFYLPSDDEHQDVGTTFYSGSAHPGGEDTCWNVPPDLRFIKKLPYKKNTFIAFMQSPTSWHSLELSPYPQYLRRSFFSPIITPPEVYIKYYGIKKYILNYLEK